MDKLTLAILQEDDPESPRSMFDNLGTMYCFHGRYNLGDVGKSIFGSPDELQAAMKRENWIVLPLYLYDHSGLTMATTPFSCPWDSGQVGYICVSREKVREEYRVKAISPKLKASVLQRLRGEVTEYDQYLRGDVWGFVIEDEEGNHVDSCWGFYGRESAEQEGKDMLEDLQEQYKPDYQI